MAYFGIWNMEYSEIWNILENGIFLNMEYFENGKVQRKHFVISHKPDLPRFGI